jgi:hypothetical protein
VRDRLGHSGAPSSEAHDDDDEDDEGEENGAFPTLQSPVHLARVGGSLVTTSQYLSL